MKNSRVIVLVVFIALAVYGYNQPGLVAQSGTALGNLAASMSPGAWAELNTVNINPTLMNTGGASGFLTGDSQSIKWDPVSRQLLYVGQDHGPGGQRFVSYKESDNTWSILPQASHLATPNINHSYDHMAIDPVNRYFYHRASFTGRTFYRYHIDTQTWTKLDDNTVLEYFSCCAGVDYFPELNGVVWFQGGEIISGGNNYAGVFLRDNNGGTWERVGLRANYTAGLIDNYAEYSPVHKVMIMGGGDGPGEIWRLNADRTITRLNNSPVLLGNRNAVVTLDPVTGNFIVLSDSSGGVIREFNPATDTWRQLGNPPAGLFNSSTPSFGIVATPISNYGVTLWVDCEGSCRVWLYKHAPGSGTPPPPDTTAPTAPSSSTATAVSSSSVNVTWNGSTDNVGVTGYRVERCAGSSCTNFSQIAAPSGTSYTDGSLTASTLYRYRVRAIDAAGNLSGYSSIASATTLGATPPPPSSDFAARCAASGVVKCVGFDQASDIAGGYASNSGIFAGATTPVLDSVAPASGNSSIKFTIPSNSGADTSGSYFTNFSPDLSVQFGQNTDFWVQWRQKFSPEFLSTRYQGSNGWKQVILVTGDQPGRLFASCEAIEIVVQDTERRGLAQLYHSCTGSASHGAYDPFEKGFFNDHTGYSDITLQNARPSPYCTYLQGEANPPTTMPPAGNCIGYFPNEWMTFQLRVKPGPLSGGEFINSYIELWIAREGQPSQQAYNWGPYNLSAGPASENQKYGKIFLLPYQTNKDSTQSHPTGYTWYDELIISTNRIADPGGPPPPPPPPDTVPPVVSSVAATNVTTSGATVSWTTNEASDTQIEYGTSTSYGSTTNLNGSLVTSHSQSLSGLLAGTVYNYRVKSRDVAGNLTTSSNYTFTTATVGSPPPPPPPPPPGGGLQGFWRMDESGGATVQDSSGSQITGALSGGTWTAGRYGNALRLDGVDDNVSLNAPAPLGITGSMTISAWINSSSFPSNDAAIVSRRDAGVGYQLDTTVDMGPRTIGFKLSGSTGSAMMRYGATAMTTNTWYHVAGVYDASARTMNVYLNGQLDNGSLAGTVDSSQFASTSAVYLGRRTGAGYFFAGSLDDVRIYARALTQAEIQSDMGGVPSDATPPTVSLTSPAGGSTVSGTSVNVSATASDNVGVVGVQFRLDGNNLQAEDTTAPYSVTWNTTTVSNGVHTLTAIARDAAGNQTTSANVSVSISNADTIGPVVFVNTPLPNSTVSGNSVTVSATASDNVAVVGVQFQLDGANFQPEDTSAPYSVTWNTTTASNGTHTLTAIARDAVGNRTTAAVISLTVNNSSDITAPSIFITSPSNGSAVYGASVLVSATASDNVTVAGVQFQLNGINLQAEDTIAPYLMTWNTTAVPNGAHTLTATARDAAGNRTTTSVVNVTVSNNINNDGIAPLVSISGPSTGTTVSGRVDVAAAALDVVGVVGVQFYFDGARLGREDSSVGYSRTWDTTTARNGPHNLTAVARDAAGNRATSATVVVTVNNDKTAPAVSISTPLFGTTVSGTVNISALATDSAGVAGVQFKLNGSNLGPEVRVAPFQTSWTTTRKKNGIYFLTAVARDLNGNRKTSPPVMVDVRNTQTAGIEPTDPGSEFAATCDELDEITVGYGRLNTSSAAILPLGVAVFGFRNESVLVSEAGVPASTPVRNGRLYLDIDGPVNTGIALANPSNQDALISFYFTDRNGIDFGHNSFTLGANRQHASFLNQAPFNGWGTMRGTFTFTSSVPVGVIALRGFANEQPRGSEFLMTTLPIVPLDGEPSMSPVNFPHFADGGGWTTQILLVNPTDSQITGNVRFMGPGTAGIGVTMTVGGVTGNIFNYTIAPRSSTRLVTGNATENIQTGGVLVTPDAGIAAPAGLAAFSFKNRGVTVSEAGVPALQTGTRFRSYVEVSNGGEQIGSIRSGLSLANPSTTPTVVELELINSEGFETGLVTTVELPDSGNLGRFVNELFPTLDGDFQGVVRVTSQAPIAMIGLRGQYNERADFLITTVSVANESMAQTTAQEMLFPHIASGGGYSTRFIVVSGEDGATFTGNLRLMLKDGSEMISRCSIQP